MLNLKDLSPVTDLPPDDEAAFMPWLEAHAQELTREALARYADAGTVKSAADLVAARLCTIGNSWVDKGIGPDVAVVLMALGQMVRLNFKAAVAEQRRRKRSRLH